jgi:hypothetical protein
LRHLFIAHAGRTRKKYAKKIDYFCVPIIVRKPKLLNENN